MSYEHSAEAAGFPSLMERFSSQVSISKIHVRKRDHSFLSFLATAQKLGVDFLPIEWQSARQAIGSGGTSKVEQGHANMLTKLAFKRISNKEKREKSESEIFEMLTNEIAVLSHPSVRDHQNIAPLQGICWDVSSNGKVWPVLVFERSQYGDLRSFSKHSEWKTLNVRQRGKLCFDIGDALADMHSSNIIHGDLKPENVLIFSRLSKTYNAKVIDFGYSSRYSDDDDLVRLPISQPWNAPEHTRVNQGWSPMKAKMIDMFSFGMLFLWVLFKERLPQTALFKAMNPGEEEYQSFPSEEEMMDTLLRLKNGNKLSSLASQLVETDKTLLANEKANMEDFFSSVLSNDQSKRDMTGDTVPIDKLESMQESASATEFKIQESLMELYGCDYRVRSYIARCIEASFTEVSESPIETSSTNLAFQLALCYELGFGIKRDSEKSKNILCRSGQQGVDFEHYLKPKNIHLRARIASDLRRQGHLPNFDQYPHYLEQQNLEGAITRLTQEVKDTSDAIGHEHPITIDIKYSLACLLSNHGSQTEAKEMHLQIMETSTKTYGNDNLFQLASMNNLALMYLDDGQWMEAEKLSIQAMEATTSKLGTGDPHTMTSMRSLALVYRTQERWEEAEKLEKAVLETSTRVLGADHSVTLDSLICLATTYFNQARYDEAEKLHRQVMKLGPGVLGIEHPIMLSIKANLAHIYSTQGRRTENHRLQHQGEDLGIQAMEERKRILGAEHPDTLTSMGYLASNYANNGQWKEAEELFLKATEIRKRVLGIEHPSTLTSLQHLSTIYHYLGREAEAEMLDLQVLEARKRVLGIEHPDTLTSLASLARIYMDKQRWREAQELNLQAVEIRKKILGVGHIDTLISMTDLTLTNIRQGQNSQEQWKELERLSLQIIEWTSNVQGAEHPDTLNSKWNLAVAHWNLDRQDEAVSLMEHIEGIRVKTLGEDHQDTISAREKLQAWKKT